MQRELFEHGPWEGVDTENAWHARQSGTRLARTRSGQTVELIATLTAPFTDAALEAAFPADGDGAALLDATGLCAETVIRAEEKLLALYLRAVKAAEGRHLYLRAPLPEGQFGMRTLLESPALLTAHLLAALRASPYGRVSLLFPAVCTVREIAAARQLTEQAMQTLLEREQIFDELVECGIELVTPAAALLSRSLAEEVDLLTVDTDRLAASALAASPASPHYEALLESSATAVLRLIEVAVGNAHLTGRRVMLYGDLLARPVFLPHLLAMGADALAAPPARLAALRDRIRALP